MVTRSSSSTMRRWRRFAWRLSILRGSSSRNRNSRTYREFEKQVRRETYPTELWSAGPQACVAQDDSWFSGGATLRVTRAVFCEHRVPFAGWVFLEVVEGSEPFVGDVPLAEDFV